MFSIKKWWDNYFENQNTKYNISHREEIKSKFSITLRNDKVYVLYDGKAIETIDNNCTIGDLLALVKEKQNIAILYEDLYDPERDCPKVQ